MEGKIASCLIMVLLALVPAGESGLTPDESSVEVQRVRDILSGVAQLPAQVEDFDDRVSATLEDHSDRLQRIEETLNSLRDSRKCSGCPCGDSCRCSGKCPESCPVRAPEVILAPVKAEIPPAPSRVNELIASHYRRPWTFNGSTAPSSALRSHLISHHGFSDAELPPAGDPRLMQVHSAIHELERGAPIVRRMTQARSVRRSVQRCPGGVCPW